MTLASEVGHGTTFEVWLPAAEAGDGTRDAAPVIGAPTGANEVVLVVDDEDNIRQVARKTLERGGYQVRLAANGAEAVEIYGQDPDAISVVLTDMSMPVMDGAEATRLLRSINPHVCIVASSGLESRGGTEQIDGSDPRKDDLRIVMKDLGFDFDEIHHSLAKKGKPRR